MREIEKIRKIQMNEVNAHITKKHAAYNDFKKKRALDLNNLLQKFKNKRNDLISEQKNFQLLQDNMSKTKTILTLPGSTRNSRIFIFYII